MQKSFIAIVIFLGISFLTFGQDSEVENSDKKPVRDPWSSIILIDNQTTYTLPAKTFHFIIQHRFGHFNNGLSDLYGIYGASNIRLSLHYSITNKIAAGFGTVKFDKLQDFELKWNLLEQNRDNSIPLSVAYYGNMTIDARDKFVFGADYKFIHRLSYFNQIIVGRKFNKLLSLQVAPAYIHYNIVDSLMNNDMIAISLGGRVKLLNNLAITFETNQQINPPTAKKPQASFALGVEIETSTHTFQIFTSGFNKLVPQKNFVFNQNKFSEGDLLLGFNILIKF